MPATTPEQASALAGDLRPTTDAAPVDVSANDEPRSPEEKRRAMSWAQRIKRVFNIEVTSCTHCGGSVRIVASIEEPHAIRAILAHFEKHGAREQAHYHPAGLRSARCRESARNGRGRRCTSGLNVPKSLS